MRFVLLSMMVALALPALVASGQAAGEPAPQPGVAPAAPNAPAPADNAKPDANADAKDDAKADDEGEKLTVTVKSTKGTAYRAVHEGEKTTWVALKVGEKLDEETIIRTGFSSNVVLQFADNSEVTVRSATKMGIARFRRKDDVTKTQLGLKYGSVRATVAKAKGPNDFTVTSPVATLAITGSGGDAGFCGDIGFKTTCDTGSFKVLKGFQVRKLGGGESSNNRMSMATNIAKALFTTQLGDVFGGVTKSEKLSLMTQSSGRGAIGFVGGGLGVITVVKPIVPALDRNVHLPGLDIGIGN